MLSFLNNGHYCSHSVQPDPANSGKRPEQIPTLILLRKVSKKFTNLSDKIALAILFKILFLEEIIIDNLFLLLVRFVWHPHTLTKNNLDPVFEKGLATLLIIKSNNSYFGNYFINILIRQHLKMICKIDDKDKEGEKKSLKIKLFNNFRINYNACMP